MVISKELSPIASWSVRLISEPQDTSLVSYSRHLFLRSLEIIKILQKEDLFIWNNLVLKNWSYWDGNEKKYINAKLDDSRLDQVKINYDQAKKFFDVEISKQKKAVPFEMEFSGKGVIYNENNEKLLLDNVIWLSSGIFIELYISIHSQSYAWLPYNLEGKLQKNIYEQNAPRLSKALKQISAIDEVELSVLYDQTQFAKINLYSITNLENEQGIPLNFEK